MWAEKGGLDFEGRARWDAWTAVKASTARAIVSKQSTAGMHVRVCDVTRWPTHSRSAKAWRLPLCPNTSHTPVRLSPPQGVATAKAKLEFVRAYYEFSPKSLYKDERGAAAEKKEGA